MAGTTTRIDHAALFSILFSLADNKQAIGRRYAYWCNGAPALEAAVAAAAMTQDELGHARTLYPLLDNFTQAASAPYQIEPETRTLQYHLAFLDHEFADWSDFVATNFLLDTAITIFFAAAQESTYEPLRQRARKIVQEEQYHELHAVGWVRRLARMGGAVRSALTQSLARLWDETLCWFGPDDDPILQRLFQERIIDASPALLRRRYLQKIMPVLDELGIVLPAILADTTCQWEVTPPLPWSRWDGAARRLAARY